MATNSGFVPPILLPPLQSGNNYVPEHQAIRVESDASPGVRITVDNGPEQSVGDKTLPLTTVFMMSDGLLTFLPAGSLRLPSWEPGVHPDLAEPTPTPALVIEIFIRFGVLGASLPVGVPTPTNWLIQGIDEAEFLNTLDMWTQPPPRGELGAPDAVIDGDDLESCYTATVESERDPNRAANFVAQVIQGKWSIPLPVETPLTVIGETGSIIVRAFAEDGSELQAAPLLAALGTMDPDALFDDQPVIDHPDHPVVMGAQLIASDLPLRFYLKFVYWNVEGRTLGETGIPDDALGRYDPLFDYTVSIHDGVADQVIPGLSVQGPDASGIVIISGPRASLDRREFHFAVQVAEQTIKLQRGNDKRWPEPGASADEKTWSTNGWFSLDGATPGDFSNFSGYQLGTSTSPVTYTVGIKIRLTLSYQRPDATRKGGLSEEPARTRRLPPNMPVQLLEAKESTSPVAQFVTDEDGEVSGVTMNLRPGRPLGISVLRVINDDPWGIAHFEVADSPRNVSSHFSTRSFWSGEAAAPTRWFAPSFEKAAVDETIRASYPANKADAAAFHILKHARYTHQFLALISDWSASLPQTHLFLLRDGDSGHASSAVMYPPNEAMNVDPNMFQGNTLFSQFWEDRWYVRETIVHEYCHSVQIMMLDLLNSNALDNYIEAVGALAVGHSAVLVTDAGTALSEGLPELIEAFVIDGYLAFYDTPALNPPEGNETWPKYAYGVLKNGTKESLSLVDGRMVEGCLAAALFKLMIDRAEASAFFKELDTEKENRDAQFILNKFAEENPLQPLKDLFKWLYVQALLRLRDISKWSGTWPSGMGTVAHPTVYDFLKAVRHTQPSSDTFSFLSFHYLEEHYLIPWNLENEPPDGEVDETVNIP